MNQAKARQNADGRILQSWISVGTRGQIYCNSIYSILYPDISMQFTTASDQALESSIPLIVDLAK